MSLTTVADQTRAMIIVGSISLVTLIIGYFAYTYFVNQVLPFLNPPEPPSPTYGFGPLPQLEFPESNDSGISYRLETIGDQIPSIQGYFMPVYKITHQRSSSGFFSLDRSKEQASSLGFILEPQLLSGTRYRWIRNTPLYAQLDLDSVNNSFVLDVSWETDPSILSETNTPSPTTAVSEIKSLLKKAGFLPEDLDNGLAKTLLLKYEGNEFNEAISLSETQFIQVDLFRRPLSFNEKQYPIIHPIPGKGLVRGLVSSSRTQGKRIIELEYDYSTIDYSTTETYPFITGAEAWQLLISGQGYVAQAPTVGTEAVVRDVEVAYYEALNDTQQYLQPIYIFKGDNDFEAYVPALQAGVFQATQEIQN